jgi:hypothetical protein
MTLSDVDTPFRVRQEWETHALFFALTNSRMMLSFSYLRCIQPRLSKPASLQDFWHLDDLHYHEEGPVVQESLVVRY